VKEERVLYMLQYGIVIDMPTLLFGVYGDNPPKWADRSIRRVIERLCIYGHRIKSVYGKGYILE
jgi:hypothetical protein